MTTLAQQLISDPPYRLYEGGGANNNTGSMDMPSNNCYFLKQLTLKELIASLTGVENKEVSVKYDFGDFFPARINAWGGAFSELAIGHHTEGKPPTVAVFLELLKNAIGQSFREGSKDTFTAAGHTPLWVANHDHISHTAIMDVLDNEQEVILVTGFCEH